MIVKTHDSAHSWGTFGYTIDEHGLHIGERTNAAPSPQPAGDA